MQAGLNQELIVLCLNLLWLRNRMGKEAQDSICVCLSVFILGWSQTILQGFN